MKLKLRARWIGRLPRVGDYLMSPIRPRYAYRVASVDRVSEVHAKAETRMLQLEVERAYLAEVPPHAQIHSWRWDRRESAKRKERA